MLRRAAPPRPTMPRRARWALDPRSALFATHSRSAAPSLRPLRHGGISAFLWRTFRRQPEFWRNVADGVFAPEVSAGDRAHMFAFVNAPTQTVVELPAFLDGVSRATASVLNAAHTRDFAEWRAGRCATSPSATQLQQWCTPDAFHGLLHITDRDVPPDGISVVTHASLCRAAYDRCTLAELVMDAALANQVVAHRPWALGAHVERLQLGVQVNVVAPSTQGSAAELLRRVYHVEFLSDVSTPSSVDWRVAAIERVR